MDLLEALKVIGVEVENDILKEVLKYQDFEGTDLDDLKSECTLDSLDYSGAIHEAIDSSVYVYDSDLTQWASEDNNHIWVEKAIEEGLVDGKYFMKSIMCGQFLAIQNEVYDAISELEKDLDKCELEGDIIQEVVC